MHKISFLASLLLILIQTTSTVTVGQVDVSNLPEVTLYATVTDEAGNPAEKLEQSDFLVTEDGKPVELTGFAGIGDVRPADIVFVFDTTGSMGEEIEGVIQTCVNFAEDLERNGRDYRLGLVTFGDEVRGIYRTDDSLTADVQEFKGWLSDLAADGGDADPENPYGAIKQATQMKFRAKSQVIFILITDAPPHHTGDEAEPTSNFDDPDLTYERSLALLASPRSVTVYPVAIDYPEYIQLATETGGQFYDIQKNPDFTGIISDIGTVIASQYRLTYLTPRPDFDGTRRNIRVEVRGSSGEVEYLEPHLINIESNLLVGGVCLLPLLLALAVPWLGMALLQRTPRETKPSPAPPVGMPAPTGYPPGPIQPGPAGAAPAGPPRMSTQPANTCPACGRPVRPGARFCAGCGQTLAPPPAAPGPAVQAAAPPQCRQCGAPLRPGAKFCSKCGTQFSL